MRSIPACRSKTRVGTLVELQKQGKIRHIGLSNVAVPQLTEARKLAQIVSVQNRYNLEDRTPRPSSMPAPGTVSAFLPWYPLAAGSLRAGRGGSMTSRSARRRPLAGGAGLAAAALADDAADPGNLSIAHFEENSRRREIELSDDEFRALGA